MRKIATLALVAALCLVLTGCLTGPFQLYRSVDNWHNNFYAQQPILAAVLSPFIWIGAGVAQWVDALTDNMYYFWVEDVWAGKGTNYKWSNKEGARACLGNVFEGASFMRVTAQ